MSQQKELGVDIVREDYGWGKVEPRTLHVNDPKYYTIYEGKYEIHNSMERLPDTYVPQGVSVLARIGGLYGYVNGKYVAGGKQVIGARNVEYTTPSGWRPWTVEEEPAMLQALEDYTYFLVKHFGDPARTAQGKGRITLYEFWNEFDINGGGPNQPNFGVDPIAGDYMKLLRAGRAGFDRASAELGASDLKLIGPSFTGWASSYVSERGGRNYLEQCVKMGLLNLVDAVSFHHYPEDRDDRMKDAEGWLYMVEEQVQQMARCYSSNPDGSSQRVLAPADDPYERFFAPPAGAPYVPFYITETGWRTDNTTSSNSEDFQARQVTRMCLLAKTRKYIEGLWHFERRDHDTATWGLRTETDSPKKSYEALKALNQQVGDRHFAGFVKGGGDVNLLTQPEFVVKFYKPNANDKLAAWSTLDADGPATPRTVSIPFQDGEPVTYYDMYGNPKGQLTPREGTLPLPLSLEPIYVDVPPAAVRQPAPPAPVRQPAPPAPVRQPAPPAPIYYGTERLAVRSKSADRHVIIPQDRPSDPNLSGGKGTQLKARAVGAFVTYTVNVPRSGTYNVKVKAKKWSNRGKFRLSVGGVACGAVQDLYAPAIRYVTLNLGNIRLAGGRKNFRFKVVGKNARSSGHQLALDAIILTPR